jgi:hypothetical protein
MDRHDDLAGKILGWKALGRKMGGAGNEVN